MKIEYSDHLKLRIKLRNFPENYPRLIFLEPDFKLVNSVTKHGIAIKKLFYNKKERYLMIAYDKINEIIKIITIHPISIEEINSRLKRGRWIYEK